MMREQFIEYYTPADIEYKKFLTDGILVLDANVLLSPYKVDATTRNQFFSMLENLRDRIWVPYHAAWEFFQNRPSVLSGEDKVYQNLEKPLQDARDKVRDHLATLVGHPVVTETEGVRLIRHLEDALSLVAKMSSGRDEKLEDALRSDSILAKWEKILEGRIGSKPSEDDSKKYEDSAKERYDKGVPPGNLDAKKLTNKYGDAIIWMQILDYAKSNPAPVLLLTNDVKEDWYRRQSGRTIGPRVELVREMKNVAGVEYYQQRLSAFLSRASEILQQPISNEAIEQVSRTSGLEFSSELERAVAQTLSSIVPMREIYRAINPSAEPPMPNLRFNTSAGSAGIEVVNHSKPLSSLDISYLAEMVQESGIKGLLVVSSSGFTRVAQQEIDTMANRSNYHIEAIHWKESMPEEFLRDAIFRLLEKPISKSVKNIWK
ncbi:PIN domain-containing protein [Streptomyces sp. H39-S7]|uniref:PIN domain-containing protein n=1 Tax=Streptomyces sp. H39-S7 TaxID=3004357 RepID=UPI0022AF14D2|nr:PIN domain-containing protein [Streptomyces sp. H39-S7]MCZ4125296.1 PIN-like domain-containing protein [Streptomyces sp. H39-S7]